MNLVRTVRVSFSFTNFVKPYFTVLPNLFVSATKGVEFKVKIVEPVINSFQDWTWPSISLNLRTRPRHKNINLLQTYRPIKVENKLYGIRSRKAEKYDKKHFIIVMHFTNTAVN